MDVNTPDPLARPPRMLPLADSSGRLNLITIGRPRFWFSDTYVRLMRASWGRILLIFCTGFIGFNLLFATLFRLVPGTIVDSSSGASAGTFLDAFFFSVQTVATIGYGVLYPKTLYGNVLVTIEIMAGVVGFAMGNGLMFARFSRPTARVIFSRCAIVAPFDGVPTLMFRAANQRNNMILEAHVQVSLVRTETLLEGREMRRFRDLPVVRSTNPSFALTWTVLHPLDEASPLFGISAEEIAASDLELVVTISGTDETFSQTIFARHSYSAADLVWGASFPDIVSFTPDGRRVVDYRRFHEVVPLT